MNKKWLWLAAAAVLALLVAGVAVRAQNGDGYELRWTAVGGGGGESSGDYTLLGTAGQSGSGTLSGGSYTAHGGVWHGAACIGPGVAMTAGANVTFSWSGSAQNVYRAVDDPFFMAGAQIGTWESSAWSYGEPLLGDTTQNAYYVVGPSVPCGRRTAEFDFAIMPGT